MSFYSGPTKNNKRTSSNPCVRAAGQNYGNLDVQNCGNQGGQNYHIAGGQNYGNMVGQNVRNMGRNATGQVIGNRGDGSSG